MLSRGAVSGGHVRCACGVVELRVKRVRRAQAEEKPPPKLGLRCLCDVESPRLSIVTSNRASSPRQLRKIPMRHLLDRISVSPAALG